MINITMDARYIIVRKDSNNISAMMNDRGIVHYPLEELDVKKLEDTLSSLEDMMINIFKIKRPDPNKDY